MYGLGVATQPDGKVVACGRFITSSPFIQRGFIVRFDEAGRLDGEFNKGAPVIVAHENSVILEAVTIRKNDGAIIAVGSAARVGVMLGAIVVLNSSGSFNLVFNNGKPLISNFAPAGGHWRFCDAKPDGSILVAGYSSIRLINSSDAFMTARYLANGSLDPLFNGQGYAVFDDELPLFLRHVALLKDDRIAACGEIRTPDSMSIVGGWIVRYQV
ncbi:hypothetical protein GIW70_06195 [Pseudomonas syringae]|nr:hypothetical protein [Pseudomonas syringae]